MPRTFLALAIAAGTATPLLAQAPPLVLPKASPRATVTQTVGLTQITITYDRPAINGREVWGSLVPFDSVWRAGANENTVIAFSSPVRMAGREVAAGRYGIHMIPGRERWTVVLSRQANAWGSFGYDPADDLFRFETVPMAAAEPQERLAYTFDGLGGDSVVATLRWERLAVPIPIAVNTREVVADSLRQQLRGLHQFFWQPWAQAATWVSASGGNLEEATAWADRSIAINENYTNLRLKAGLLEKRGDAPGAAELRRRAFAIATEAVMNAYGYELLGQGQADSAIAVFRKNVKDYPRSWNTYDSLGEALAKQGDKQQAIEMYRRARRMTQDPNEQRRIDGVLRTLM